MKIFRTLSTSRLVVLTVLAVVAAAAAATIAVAASRGGGQTPPAKSLPRPNTMRSQPRSRME